MILASLSAWLSVVIMASAIVPVIPQETSSSACSRGDPKAPMEKFLGHDNGSGCSCKTMVDSSFRITCFGQLECKSFPKDFNVSFTSILWVRTTSIASLRAGDLDKMSHLTDLAVDNAANLTTIEPGFFKGMTNLVNLSLSSNKLLTHLEENTFEYLFNLTSLSLVDNGFKVIADAALALGPMVLPKLDILHLDRNTFEHITMSDFRPMQGSSVSELHLTSCSLHSIHPQALEALSDLSVLKVGGNLNLNVSQLTDAIDYKVRLGKSLLSLGLDSVGLNSELRRRLLKSVAEANVTELVLSDNLMEQTTGDTFPPMPNLRYLDLSKMHLVKISDGTFARNVMPSLERLNLCCNKLSEAASGVLPEQLIYLDLSSNNAELYFIPGTNRFANMTSLKHFYLSNNKIVRLNRETFAGLRALEVLYLDNASIFKIDHGSFDSMRKLEFLNLEKNRLQMRFFHPDIFLGLVKLKVLLLGENGLENLGENSNLFLHLKSLTYLGLQKNVLKTLDHRIFHPLPFLEGVDLSDNQISAWPKSNTLFDQNTMLRCVDASRNDLTILNEFILEDLVRIAEVDLSRNSFHCGCEFRRALTAFKNNHEFTTARNASLSRLFRYYCRSPEKWLDKTILEFSMSDSSVSTCTTTSLSLPLQILLPLLFLFFLVAGFFLARLHKRVCKFYFWIRDTVRQQRRRSMIGNEQEMSTRTNYQYDAFVSYSNEDRPFVLKLVSMLEEHEPFFRLCVYERDFSIGAPITDAIVNSVTSSRKVLLVVSDSFARSNWCSWETHVAHHQRVAGGYENEEGLLVIKLGRIHESDLSPTLRYLLRTRVYLEYDPDPKKQDVFWRKLREALAKKSSREMASYTNNGFVGHAVSLHI